MNRRRFLEAAAAATGGVAAVAGGSILAGCGPRAAHTGGSGAGGGPRVTWRLASSFPRSLDTIFGAGEVFAKALSDLSGGQFTVKVHAPGELMPALSVLDGVQQGTIEVGHTAGYYYTGKHPALAFDTAVPFGMGARQHMAWLAAGGLDLLRKLLADFNVVPFPGGNTGVQMGGWFRRRVDTLADLRGLKMRIPGMGGKVMDALGVTVQVLAGGDIYPALERGVIDATEWVGPYDDMKLGFHQVAKLYYYPGWWEPGPALSFYVNKDAWAALGEHYQHIVEIACRSASLAMIVDYDRKNPEALETLEAQGVELVPFAPDIMNAAYQKSREMLADDAAKDATFKEIFEHWDAFRRRSLRWFATAELAYLQYAAKA